MVRAIYEAQAEGKVAQGDRFGEWVVNFAGSCEAPILIRRHADRGAVFADYMVRCRQCAPCLRAKMGYWTHFAVKRTQATADAGRRTWFGTLTLGPEWQFALRDIAMQEWGQQQSTGYVPDWWDEPKCDERFRLVRDVLLRECQKYFKRLRKDGLKFKYFLVFERHKSGLPHVHWLLHEEGEPILKKQLQKQWPYGFTKIKLVGGYDRKRKRKLTPAYAAHYVAKYLMKHRQSRQIVSIGYAS